MSEDDLRVVSFNPLHLYASTDRHDAVSQYGESDDDSFDSDDSDCSSSSSSGYDSSDKGSQVSCVLKQCEDFACATLTL